VYSRSYEGRELSFEASGGLLHNALVMQDHETDTYWSIMTGAALSGELKETRLEELPVGEKAPWREWVARHPDTLVLSVDGVEHIENNPYDAYFSSERGPRGAVASDPRLPTKAPIYAFQLDGRAYAVPFPAIEGGARFEVGDEALFLYRPPGAAVFHSTAAFLAPVPGFERRDGVWRDVDSGARFDERAARFSETEGGTARRLDGFDTFWFHWSMTHPETEVLGPSTKGKVQ